MGDNSTIQAHIDRIYNEIREIHGAGRADAFYEEAMAKDWSDSNFWGSALSGAAQGFSLLGPLGALGGAFGGGKLYLEGSDARLEQLREKYL